MILAYQIMNLGSKVLGLVGEKSLIVEEKFRGQWVFQMYLFVLHYK